MKRNSTVLRLPVRPSKIVCVTDGVQPEFALRHKLTQEDMESGHVSQSLQQHRVDGENNVVWRTWALLLS